jgi:hypothetical protein
MWVCRAWFWSLSLRKPHGDGVSELWMNLWSICFKCFRCFIGMLQVFHMDVAKVDGGCCICCNRCTHMLQTSVPNVSSVFFTRMLQVCLSGCCICFTYMLQVFYLDVAHVCNGFKCFSCIFASVSYTYFKSFIYLQTYVVSIACIWMWTCCNSCEKRRGRGPRVGTRNAGTSEGVLA